MPDEEQNHRSRKRKSLKFDENHNIIYEIPNRNEANNKQEIWFSKEELSQILTECMQSVAAMEGGGIPPIGDTHNDYSDTVTFRGLEYMTSSGFQIANSRRETVQILLQEQDRQRSYSTDGSKEVDPDLLAAAMESISRHRMRIAQLTGLKDERAAKSIFRNIDDDSKNYFWGTTPTTTAGSNNTNDSSPTVEEVRKKIAARREFRMSNRSKRGSSTVLDNTSAPSISSLSDDTMGGSRPSSATTRRSRSSPRVYLSKRPHTSTTAGVSIELRPAA